MTFKKILLGFLTLIVLTAVSVSIYAEYAKTEKVTQVGEEIGCEPQKIYFSSFTGIVQEIDKRDNGLEYVLVKNDAGQEAHLVVSENTYILDNETIKVGDEVTGFYDPNLPMIMIYPPQYKAEVIVVNKEGRNVKVDLFNEDMVSADGTLKLNLSEKTEVINEDGSKYTGDLTDKKLVVVYDVATKSIPAQTTPSKIIVLSE